MILCLYDPGMTSGCPTHVSVRFVAECYLGAPDVYLHRDFFAFGFPMPIKGVQTTLTDSSYIAIVLLPE